MRRFPTTLQKIIQESGLNLNNISQASGISNAYLAKLTRDNINRPGKDKITSILLALNYTISEINRILRQYDYQPLHVADIPDILHNNRSRRIVGGNLPQYDHIYFDLLLIALERIGGNKVYVKNRPSGVFMPHELYLMKEYPYESNDAAAVFRYNLTQHILYERQEIFQHNLKTGYFSETYICKTCFTEYLERHLSSAAEKENPRPCLLTLQYLANALSLSLKRPNHHKVYIIERCPYFHFMIQDIDGVSPKVSYPGRKLHSFDNEFDKRMLEGFTTDLPHIVAHFRNEVEMSKNGVPPAQLRNFPDMFKDSVFAMVARYNLDRKLADNLDHLMETAEPVFF